MFLRFLGVTTRDRASSCSGGDKSLPTGDGDEWCSSSLLLLLSELLEVVVVVDGMVLAGANRPGAGLKVGGRGNAAEVGVVVTGNVIFGVMGLYMETGPCPLDLGAALSLT